MKVVSIVGTRPNFNKEMLIAKELARRAHEEILVHTGQHYDYAMSDIFFKECELPAPKYKFSASSGSGTIQISEMLVKLDSMLREERPDVTLVYGDVNSTLAAAIASAKLKIPVAHIEAGVRDNQIYNPEEINRRVTDTLSHTLFAPTYSCYENLLRENFPEGNIFFTGDVVYDSLLYFKEKYNIKIDTGNYVLATVHREENVNNKERLTGIIYGLIDCGEKVLLPAHPRTLNKLKEYGLFEVMLNSNISLLEPQGYLEFLNLLARCKKVLTDSGGVRREAYMLQKLSVVPIDILWFPELFQTGWSKSVRPDRKDVCSALRDAHTPIEHLDIFGAGDAHKKIIDILEERYAKR